MSVAEEAIHSGEGAALSPVVDWLLAEAGDIPHVGLSYEPDLALLWIALRPVPKPVFTLESVSSVVSVQAAVQAYNAAHPEAPVRFVAYHADGENFSLGGDLDHYLGLIESGDRAGLLHYAHVASQAIVGNVEGFGGQVVTIGCVQGRALGGGIDPARACNVMVAERRAVFQYPEISHNHFPITAVPILTRRVGSLEAERIVIGGGSYTAEQFHERGVLDAVVDDGDGREWVRRTVKAAARSHRARLALHDAFGRRHGDLRGELDHASRRWVDHMLGLTETERSTLRRLSQAQARLMRPARTVQ